MLRIGFPINLFTIFLALSAPIFLLVLVVAEPVVGLLVIGGIVAISASRRARRRREAKAIEYQMQHNAELQAEAIARRLREDYSR